MKNHLRLAFFGSALSLILAGCSGRGGGPAGGPAPGPGGFPGSDDPPAAQPGSDSPLGLDSAVAGDGTIRVEWRAPSASGPVPDLALLLKDTAGLHVGASPYAITPGTTHLVVTGLTNGQELRARLGMRPTPTDPYTSHGQRLTVRIGPVAHVDVAAAAGGDGSLLTPYNDLGVALLATSTGGGNVWVAGGDFPGVSQRLFPGVDIYGGFPSSFDLNLRDTQAHPTRLHGLFNLPVLTMVIGQSLAIVDGMDVLGEGLASIGLEVEDTPFEARKVNVSNCKRGIKFRRGLLSDAVRMRLTASTSRNNILQGLSGEGPLTIAIDGCDFSGNGQEGFEMAAWLAPDGEDVSLDLRDCSFWGNGGEGVDVDMIAPLSGGATGAQFLVRVESCSAQTNGLAGFLFDIDYETAPAWSSDILLTGCYSRGNGGPGIFLDLDGNAAVLVQRAACSANRGSGLAITSEIFAGTATVSSSAFVGNQGLGIRSSIGNVGLLVSQCLVAGNGGGGIASSPAPVSIVSSVAYLQSSAWSAGAARFVAQQADADPAPFAEAPRGFAQILSQSGLSGELLTLDVAPSGPLDAVAEVSDDGVARAVLSVGGTTIEVNPPPTNLFTPQPLSFYASGSSTIDDYQLALTSIARDAGLPPLVGGTSDAGPFGTLHGGTPGATPLVRTLPFYCSSTAPSWGQAIAAGSEIILSFTGGVPDPLLAPLSVEAVDSTGAAILATPSVALGLLHVAPPAGGWPVGASIRLHAQLPAVSGATLVAPVIIPLQVN